MSPKGQVTSWVSCDISEYTDASPKTIQAIAGHRDIRTTMSIYEHARKDKIDKASGDIHNLLFNQNVNF